MSGLKSVKILLTGYPGCGKTTAIMNIISRFNPDKIAGFYTRELRQHGRRLGFRWCRLDGAEGILAHVDIEGPFRVGKYGVDVTNFEKNVVPLLELEKSPAELKVIDEIGKMECFSAQFIETVRALFASDRSVLASVALKGSGFIAEVKEHPDARIFYLTPDNRNQIADNIVDDLSAVKK
jgi:nucleoside-triphosphatase